MHEMSLAMSIFEMAVAEAEAAGCDRLVKVHINYGQLAGIMPDALEMAYDALKQGTIHEKSSLQLHFIPLKLRCQFCHMEFTPEEGGHLAPCPGCGEMLGHIVLEGRELLLARIEADSPGSSEII